MGLLKRNIPPYDTFLFHSAARPYYAGTDVPAFLLTVFGKNEKANLTKAERNGLAALTKTLTDSLRRT